MLKRTTVSWVLAAVLATGASTTWAAPEPTAPSDAVMRLLQERGLHLDSGTPLLDQVRDTASDLVVTAMNFIGVRYKLGGVSEETGFDCSGFTRYIFEKSLGYVLPRRAAEQARASNLLTVDRNELRPGDLVFFNTLRRTFSHVGIYVGDGKFIHAPRSGSNVRVDDMTAGYWVSRFNGARRVPQAEVQPPAAPQLPIPAIPLTATAPIQTLGLR